MIGRILTVARREFAGYFDHATAYILLVIFLGINFYFYFQEAYLLGEASLRPMLSPWRGRWASRSASRSARTFSGV